MSYAIIGFGKIGQALAKAFARNGIEVSVATTRDPESFASDAAAIGPTIIPKTLAEAVEADMVFLAVRYESIVLKEAKIEPGRILAYRRCRADTVK
jgi:predicted dinucleotide-binding enzyme